MQARCHLVPMPRKIAVSCVAVVGSLVSLARQRGDSAAFRTCLAVAQHRLPIAQCECGSDDSHEDAGNEAVEAANSGNLELREVWFSYPLRPQSGGAQLHSPARLFRSD